jgi:hypothetical protein
VKEPCDHERKARYGENEDVCFIKVGPVRNRETSFVAVPSDVGAMVKDVDVDQETMAVYAGNPLQEFMFDMRDPNRRNLLESNDTHMATLAGQLLEQSKEFYESYHMPKTYFISEGGEGDVEEAKLKAKARKALPSGKFALVYKDKKTGKTVRRFPIHDLVHAQKALQLLPKAKGLTSAQRATVRRKAQAALARFKKKKGKKESMTDELSDKEVEKLLEDYAPSEAENDEDSPVVIEIDGENYALLYHVIEELEDDLERADQVIAEKDEIIAKQKDQLEGKEDEVEEKDDDTETRSESSDKPDENVEGTDDGSSDDKTGESEKDIEESDDSDKSKEKEKSADDDDSSNSDESTEEGTESHEEHSSDSEEDSEESEEDDTEDGKESDDSGSSSDTGSSEADLGNQRQGIDSAYQAAVRGLTGERDELKEALAIAVAALTVQVRPASRGKSVEELVEKLRSRTSESLRDTLKDLQEELESSEGPVVDKDKVETVTDEHEEDVPVVEDNDSQNEPEAPKIVGNEGDFWSDVQKETQPDVKEMVDRLKQKS